MESEQRKILEGHLAEIRQLFQEARATQRQINDMSQEIEKELATAQITQLTYQVRCEQVRRSRQDIDACLRRLDRQHKITLQKIHELEEEP